MEWVACAVLVLAGLIIVGIFSPPSACTICGSELKKTRYKWKLDGKTHHVCPNCNNRLKREKSKTAMDAFMAKR